MRKIVICVSLLALLGCQAENKPKTEAPKAKPAVQVPVKPMPPTRAELAYAEHAMPDDEVLAEKYEYSCASCHTLPDTGAPIAGHQSEWQFRIKEKGFDALLETVKAGYKTMPVNGNCEDCTEEDLKELIVFLTSKPK